MNHLNCYTINRNKISLKYLFILFFFSFNVSLAQINIEKYRSITDTAGISGIVKLDITAKTGNVDLQEIGFEGRIDYSTEITNNLLVFDGSFGWKDQEQFSNEALGHLRHVRKLNELLNAEIFGQINYNKARLLLLRLLTGGGFRFDLLKEKGNRLWLGTSYMLEREKYDVPENAAHPQVQTVSRFSGYVNYSLNIKKGINFSTVLYYQPRFDKPEDYKFLNENSFIVNLSDHIALSTEVRLFYDSRPPDTVKKFDTKTKIGVIFIF